jgi:uncharacterized protein YfaS (alpha-2-macroglobulin family)
MAAPRPLRLHPLAPLFLLLLLVFSPPPAHAEYANAVVAGEAARYDALLRDQYRNKTSADFGKLLNEGVASYGAKEYRSASELFAAAYVSGGGPRALLHLSASLLNITPVGYEERYQLPERAGAAAYLAYQKATSDRSKADALVFLARALEQRQRWRETLDALSTSLALNEQKSTREYYDRLYGQYGFRITDYNVDSDSAAPRLCVNFSEKLSASADYAKFVELEGSERPAVSVSGQQLCIEGIKHGNRYNVRLRAGLPADIDDKLSKTSDMTVYVKDRTPSVRVPGNKYVLPRTGQIGIPVTSVNTDKVHVEVYRVGDRGLTSTLQEDFLKQMTGYNVNDIRDKLGARVFEGTLDVAQKLNEDVVTAFPVGEAVPEIKPGVYVLVADAGTKKDEDEWEQKTTQWFIVSDLGLTALSGDDGINLFVRSLTSAETLAGVAVKLVARNNEILATGTTDNGGFVNFPAGITGGAGGMAPALITAEAKNGDYAFIDLGSPAFDLSDRGVAGRVNPGPVDVMLFTERGVYKPGETVHLTGLARDKDAKALKDLPLTFKFFRPDGVEHFHVLAQDEGLGGRKFSLTLDPSVRTGTWRALAYVDPKGASVGETSFLVEDFVPERMDMTVDAKDKVVAAGRPIVVDIDGKYLYGSPAADHGLEGEIDIRERKGDTEGFIGYRFGLEDEEIKPTKHALTDLPRTDAGGKAHVVAELPLLPDVTKPLTAELTLRLRDPSGRSIERHASFGIAPQAPLIGIKPLFTELGEDSMAEFEVAVMSPDGKRADFGNLSWELVRLDTRYQWYSRDGSWNYEPIVSEERIATGTVDAKADAAAKISAAIKWGRYRLDVRSKETGRPAASAYFDSGWYASALSESPDMLDVALDKADYTIGETAKLRIVSRMAGNALITVLNGGVREMKAIAVPKGETSVDLTVNENWGAGAYVAVNLYRPMDVSDKRMPSRAVGLKWLNAGHDQRLLQVSMEPPAKIRPEGALDVPVKLDGLKPGEEAYVVAAAVDVGILNLTGYKPPSPDDFFLGQRKLATEFRDIYGKLIDGMQGAPGKLRVGGDEAGGLNPNANPPEEKPVALYSGVIRVDDNGRALLHFDVPVFNGTLKVMTVAWSAGRMGHAATDVIVRDPVIVIGTAPHFLKIGDRSQLHLALHNVEGPAGEYQLALSSGGLAKEITGAQSLQFALNADERRSLSVPLAPDAIGRATITAHLTGPGGIDIARSYVVPVEPAYPTLTRQSVQTLASGTRLILTNELFTGLVAGTQKATVAIGPSSLPDVPGLLASLDRYPYGCSEQITSRALPLLYLSSVADQAGIEEHKRAEIKEQVQKAIDTLVSRQGHDGSFGLWSAGDGEAWLSAYVTEFLTRAREQGYSVPERQMTQALDKLSNSLGYASDFENGGEDIAYSIYVLARNKRARLGEMRYYADEKLKNFATPLAKSQLAAALALYGDEERAERAFRAAIGDIDPASVTGVARRLGSDYGSNLRDGAATLALISETGLRARLIPAVSNLLDSERVATDVLSTSTQEKAWLLLAANALFDEAQTYRLDVDGQKHAGPLSRTLTPETLQTAFNVVNEGVARARAVITISGSPEQPEPARANGFTIERTYYTLAGDKVDPSQVVQNTRLAVVLTINEGTPLGGQIMVQDPLPAGFEIDNPRLVSSADVSALSFVPPSDNAPKYMEFRDDRFQAAFDLTAGQQKTLAVAYIVRAVAPGRYVHGAASVEDMYRPERVASTDTGFVEVVASK